MEEKLENAPEPKEEKRLPEETLPEDPESEQALALRRAQEELARIAQRLQEHIKQCIQENARVRQETDERARALADQEMQALSRRLLREKELPEELAEGLVYDSEDSLRAGIDQMEAAFRAAVQRAVEQRLSDRAPRSAAVTPLEELPDDEYYAAVCRMN